MGNEKVNALNIKRIRRNKLLIASFDLEVGGVERSLISMLKNFNYEKNQVDLMLYSHKGEFLSLLTDKIKLMDEVFEYSIFRKSIKEVIKSGEMGLAITRLLAKFFGYIRSKTKPQKGDLVYQMQYMWKFAMFFLPKAKNEYDVAISYLWPHYYVAEKVKSKKKIAWIHTDYSTIVTDIKVDLKMWNKFNYIISISDECTRAFLEKYPSMSEKIILVENITSPNFVRTMANEYKVEEYEQNNFNLLTVGRLCYQKAIDNAVRALKILHDRGLNNIKWYVVGYGSNQYMIEDLIKENQLQDSFILLGKKTNPYPYMKACDLYIQPSRYEGKAVTIAEAQILGKPVLITEYPTAKSQIREGVDGVITELSIEGIADGIEKLYNDKGLRDLLANNCKNNDYSNSNELEKLYKLFDT